MSKTACVRFIQRTECGCKGTIWRKRCQVFSVKDRRSSVPYLSLRAQKKVSKVI